MNPNTSNKRAVEYLKSNPKYRKYAIAWLRRRKRNLRIRYKEKYKKDYISYFSLVEDIFQKYENWAKEHSSEYHNLRLYRSFLSRWFTNYYKIPFEERVQLRYSVRDLCLKYIMKLGYPNLYSVD